MKGLIIKDLMCLRKQRIIFIYTVVATVVLSVMFVLSARYGNIHAGTMQMVAEKQLNGVDVKNMGTMALVVFMILPIALVGDAATVFVYDGKAGFANVCATLPLSINRRVMAKFITVIMMFGIGVSIDLVISFVLSVLTDIITFSEFLGIIISTASVMGIYGSITIFYCFCLGYGKESYAQILSIFSMVAAFILINFSSVKKIITDMSTPETGENDLTYFTEILDFIKFRYYILFGIAVLVMIAAYFGTVTVAKRKRGMTGIHLGQNLYGILS